MGINQSQVDSPHKGPVMWNIDVFFVVSLEKSQTASDLRQPEACVTSP